MGLSASEVVGVSSRSFLALSLSSVSPFGSLWTDDEEAVFSSRFVAASVISLALF